MSSRLLALLGSLFVIACGPGDHTDPPCPGPNPAFRVLIRTASGATLPLDVVIRVEYGGDGAEEHRVASPSSRPQVLFCAASPNAGNPGTGGAGQSGAGNGGKAGDGGSDGSAGEEGEAGEAGAAGQAGQGGAGGGPGPQSVQCELWTDGAARISIEGQGLKPYEKNLSATIDERCGITTTLMNIELEAEQPEQTGATP